MWRLACAARHHRWEWTWLARATWRTSRAPQLTSTCSWSSATQATSSRGSSTAGGFFCSRWGWRRQKQRACACQRVCATWAMMHSRRGSKDGGWHMRLDTCQGAARYGRMLAATDAVADMPAAADAVADMPVREGLRTVGQHAQLARLNPPPTHPTRPPPPPVPCRACLRATPERPRRSAQT